MKTCILNYTHHHRALGSLVQGEFAHARSHALAPLSGWAALDVPLVSPRQLGFAGFGLTLYIYIYIYIYIYMYIYIYIYTGGGGEVRGYPRHLQA